MGTENRPESVERDSSRRNVLKAVAWSVPAIAVAATVPSAAASSMRIEGPVVTFTTLTIDKFRPQFVAETLSYYHSNLWIGVPPGATVPTSISGSVTFRLYQNDTLLTQSNAVAFLAQAGFAGVTFQRPPVPPGMYRLEFQVTLQPQEIDGNLFVPNPIPTLTLEFEAPTA